MAAGSSKPMSNSGVVGDIIVAPAQADDSHQRHGAHQMTKNKFAAAAVALAVATLAQAQPLPTATPESVGMSTERLRNIETFFAGEIERNRVPGAVVAI